MELETFINELVEVHNTLFEIKVSGDDVIKMATSRGKLQQIIQKLVCERSGKE